MADLGGALDEIVAAFDAFEAAIDNAHRRFHNYQDWEDEERDSIDAARTDFYAAVDRARLRVGEPPKGQ